MKYLKGAGLLLLYLGVQTIALVLAFPYINAGLQASATPSSVQSIIPLLAAIIIAPIFIILFAKKAPNSLNVVRFVFLGAISLSLFVTLQPALALVFPSPLGFNSGLTLDPTLYLAMFVASLAFLLLYLEPQWYVVDSVGLLAGGSLTALLGIFIGILPALIFLSVLMVYDAVAVYWTKHMISLADVVSDMKLPILMVMPSQPSFDYTKMGSLKEHRQAVEEHPEDREATFMGLGDAVIPGILVVSSFVFLPTHPDIVGIGANLITALGAMAGSLVGYSILMRVVAGGNPQAGLPFLNGGAIGGYALTYVLAYHSFSLGIGLH